MKKKLQIRKKKKKTTRKVDDQNISFQERSANIQNVLSLITVQGKQIKNPMIRHFTVT